MTATSEGTTGVAHGRRLLRIANVILGATGAWLALFVVGGLVAATAGWIADSDATPALIGLAISAAGVIAYFTVRSRGNRLVRTHIHALVDCPPHDVPEDLQIGTARPATQVRTAVTIMVAAVIGLPLLPVPDYQWLVPEVIGATTVIAFVRVGPSVLSLSSAYLDRSGVRLPLLGIRIPWTSVGTVRVDGASQIAIMVTGPVTSTGDQPKRWTDRAVTRIRPGVEVTVWTSRPELAVWVARRFVDPTPPPDESPAPTTGIDQ